MKLPSHLKPYANLWYLFEGEAATPYINAAVNVGKDGWAAMSIEVRYCPYCGKDLWEALNED